MHRSPRRYYQLPPTSLVNLAGAIARRLYCPHPVALLLAISDEPGGSAHPVQGCVLLHTRLLSLPKRQVAVVIAHEVAHLVLAAQPEFQRAITGRHSKTMHRLELVADAASARLFGTATVVATLKSLATPGLDFNAASRQHPSHNHRIQALWQRRYAAHWQHVEPPIALARPAACRR